MSGNAQKTPLTKSLNAAISTRAAGEKQRLPKSLPCSVVAVSANGAIVTVKFELANIPFTLPQVTVPVETSVYRREPIQVGDLGRLKAADARLGGVSGLGTGTPDLTPPTNLGALVWAPVGNKNWAPSPNPNAYLVQGPDGVILQDMGGECVMTLTPGGVSFAC